ncbi:ABC transporter permease [Devosia sp. UYZn731]|uniref:ABC transporter permease n=1 Tax=Devosia sp. UYZn731 TaxID=3156345 RepID=UPI003390DFE3
MANRTISPQRWLVNFFCLGVPTLFVLAPIGSFILYSFWQNQNGELVRELTLENYQAFFSDNVFLGVFVQTIALCLGATLVNVVTGYAIALFAARRSPKLRFAMILLFMLPLFTSYIIKIYAVRGILGHRGVLNELLLAAGLIDQPVTAFIFSQTAIFIALVVLYLPFAILPIYLAIERIPENLGVASADLGGGAFDELWRIVLPLSMPGVVIAAVFTFVMTLGDFVAPQMVGGTGGFTFGRIVFTQFGVALNWPLGAALAVVLLFTALAAVGLAGLSSRWSTAR